MCIINQLKSCKTRADALNILANKKVSQLKTICVALDIQSSGAKKLLVDRIVERTVGYKLRSAAIQNTL